MSRELTEFFCQEIDLFLQDLTDDIICVFDSSGIIAANKSFRELFIEEDWKLSSYKLTEFLHEAYQEKLTLPAEGDHLRLSLKFVCSDGAPFYSSSVIFHREDKYLFVGKSKSATHEEALKEISQLNNELANKTRELSKKNLALRRTRAEMERVIRTDELTQLANRRAFREFAEKMLAQSRRYNYPISLVAMDIDNFKDINDSYGHKMGDRVLEKLGELLLDNVRKGDIVARMGGEEFAILLVRAEAEEAEKFAERIRRKIKGMQVGSRKIKHTVSLGVTEFKSDNDIDELMERADKALYRAKNSGKDTVVKIS